MPEEDSGIYEVQELLKNRDILCVDSSNIERVLSPDNLSLVPVDSGFEEILGLMSYHPHVDRELIERAYKVATLCHFGQFRRSGEPYISHPIAVAKLACELKLDNASIASALLHDVVEDTPISNIDLKRHFGDDIAYIVEGVTKLTRIEFDSREEKQAESFRKLLIAMAKDIRVVMVKLCDRLHNMRTLEELSVEKRIRIALETKEIYAPIANRLGLQRFKGELEDLCLFHLRPELYQSIKTAFDATAPKREQLINNRCREISSVLLKNGIKSEVFGRVKHFYSIWQKIERSNVTFDEIHDLIGFRVIVGTVSNCYEALGVVHGFWTPIPGRFKDYIAMPKPNMYQSLHTSVVDGDGYRFEIQIRTAEMHRVAEEGIAAHWRYKEKDNFISDSFDLAWVKELVETTQVQNPDEFMQFVKTELFAHEVFVFTPKGDLIRLPFGSTPIDFAYSVHTDVGHRAIGSKVNGSICTLSHKLRNGDTVEILTQRDHGPSKDWLRFVKSSKAKQRIRSYLKAAERNTALELGEEMLTKELKRCKISVKGGIVGHLEKVYQNLGYSSHSELLVDLGFGKLSVGKVLEKIMPPEQQPIKGVDIESFNNSPIDRIFARAAKNNRKSGGVIVAGFENVVIRFARCCEPLPGERIIGFITRGRGVSIHNAACAQVLSCDSQRLVPVRWEGCEHKPRKVKIFVYGHDRLKLLADISKTITDCGSNILQANCSVGNNKKVNFVFELLVESIDQFEQVKRRLEGLDGVSKIGRLSHMES